MSRLNRQRGKATERYIATRLGGRRLGTLGQEDVDTSHFSVECKAYKRFSIRKFLDQAIRNASHGKTPLLVLHEHGTRHNDDMVVMRLQDWEDWYGRIEALREMQGFVPGD